MNVRTEGIFQIPHLEETTSLSLSTHRYIGTENMPTQYRSISHTYEVLAWQCNVIRRLYSAPSRYLLRGTLCTGLLCLVCLTSAYDEVYTKCLHFFRSLIVSRVILIYKYVCARSCLTLSIHVFACHPHPPCCCIIVNLPSYRSQWLGCQLLRIGCLMLNVITNEHITSISKTMHSMLKESPMGGPRTCVEPVNGFPLSDYMNVVQ